MTLPTGQSSGSATVFIVADDEYSLYVSGRLVRTGTSYQVAQKYVVDNIQGPEIVFAVYAVSRGGPAGLLASMEVTSQYDYVCSSCNSTSYIVNYEDWKSFPGASPPAGFEQPGFDA